MTIRSRGCNSTTCDFCLCVDDDRWEFHQHHVEFPRLKFHLTLMPTALSMCQRETVAQAVNNRVCAS